MSAPQQKFAYPRVIIVMGVSGSGKTVVGEILAARLGGQFVDADQLHPAENVAKMSALIPLTDADRQPWLESLRHGVIEGTPAGHHTVLACSALKRRYREYLRQSDQDVCFLYLKGSFELIESRLASRKNHFMKKDLLCSQFEALEEPALGEAVCVDIDETPAQIVERALAVLPLTQFVPH